MHGANQSCSQRTSLLFPEEPVVFHEANQSSSRSEPVFFTTNQSSFKKANQSFFTKKSSFFGARSEPFVFYEAAQPWRNCTDGPRGKSNQRTVHVDNPTNDERVLA
jgi:hypothetical protein